MLVPCAGRSCYLGRMGTSEREGMKDGAKQRGNGGGSRKATGVMDNKEEGDARIRPTERSNTGNLPTSYVLY